MSNGLLALESNMRKMRYMSKWDAIMDALN